jgi:hypothetical protein
MTTPTPRPSAGCGKLAKLEDRWHRMADRQLFGLGIEEYIAANHQCANSLLGQGCKDRLEVAFGAYMQDMELHPEGAGRRLQFFRF